MEDMMRHAWLIALFQIMLVGTVTAFCLQSVLNLLPHSNARQHGIRSGTSATLFSDQVSYGYYTLKQHDGFVLARAPKGADGQPLTAPVPVAPDFTIDKSDGFGLSESDNVLSMQVSPDGRFLA